MLIKLIKESKKDKRYTMILCPVCGNFTDNHTCEVCGIKLSVDHSSEYKGKDHNQKKKEEDTH